MWPHPLVHEYLLTTYRHLIYDNVEEDVPRAHDLIREWMPHFESALLLYDEEAGYRRFLGADVDTGWALRELCPTQIGFSQSLVMSPDVQDLAASLAAAIDPAAAPLHARTPRPQLRRRVWRPRTAPPRVLPAALGCGGGSHQVTDRQRGHSGE